ncbi:MULTISPECIES: glycosyltransferase [unclassified Streptomyces]|uniref:glycosyltransferase n=1 Tax=unclassified Streptomyces TaxID=2593676 RepID=UPI0033C3DDF0
MKAIIYSNHGSRGDIQPYLALAYALNQAGHTSVLAGPRRFGPFAAEYGVEFAPLNDEMMDLHARRDVQEILMNNDRPTPEQTKLRETIAKELMPRLYPIILREMWEAAADGADIVVYTHSSRQATHQIAERLGVPHVLAPLYPHFVPSRDYPAGVGLSPSPDNLADHERAERQPLDPLSHSLITAWRAETLGLPPRAGWLDFRHHVDGTPTPVIHGFSPHVLKHSEDWPEWVHTTGFWSLPASASWQPPEDLQRFLENGEPPVFVGFGSMRGLEPEDVGRTVLEAVRNTGNRALVVEGWGGIKITESADDVYVAHDVPYDWLFPRVKAAVHAGGTGTHNAALLAGIPQVTCPFHREQLMWAEYLHELGVAPAPIQLRDLTTEALSAAIRSATTDPSVARRVAELAEKVGGDDGCGTAVRILEKVHANHGRPVS